MGIERTFGRETQTEHFNKQSFPLQSAICWFTHEGVSYKKYFHNISDVETEKDYSYSLDTIKWVIESIELEFGKRQGQVFS
jgi:hypothetical protein